MPPTSSPTSSSASSSSSCCNRRVVVFCNLIRDSLSLFDKVALGFAPPFLIVSAMLSATLLLKCIIAVCLLLCLRRVSKDQTSWRNFEKLAKFCFSFKQCRTLYIVFDYYDLSLRREREREYLDTGSGVFVTPWGEYQSALELCRAAASDGSSDCCRRVWRFRLVHSMPLLHLPQVM